MNFSVSANVLTAHADLSPEIEREFEEQCKTLVTRASARPLVDLSEVSYVSKEYIDILARAAEASMKRGFRMAVKLRPQLARLLKFSNYNLVGDVEEAR